MTRNGPRSGVGGRALKRSQRRTAALLATAVAALHAVGLLLLVVVVAPRHYALGASGVFGAGLGVTAYTLGMRHAFDADHIGAIDNTTRRMMDRGERPLTLGFWFALGHSTIVLALGVLVALGVRGLSAQVRDGDSELHAVASLVGPLVSGTFLLAIGALNLALLVRIARSVRRARDGELGGPELERRLDERGLLTRIFGRATGAVRRPWQMYPLGCLFGLGFDTATEVALLVLAGAGAAGGLPFYAILCLPILFAAGMTLFDTLDGAFMTVAYGWAFSRPVRRAFYNLAITGLSVAVALGIGTVELLTVAADRLSLTGGFWDVVTGIDLNAAGYAIAGLFALTWGVALLVWRVGRVEERWSR